MHTVDIGCGCRSRCGRADSVGHVIKRKACARRMCLLRCIQVSSMSNESLSKDRSLKGSVCVTRPVGTLDFT